MKSNILSWHTLCESYRVLVDPKTSFATLKTKPLEPQIQKYLLLLLSNALGAGILSLLIVFAKALYFDLTLNATINYWYLLNYALGEANAFLFLYLFCGTFLLFFVSLLLLPLTRIRYTLLLKVLFYSLSPLLIFGWFYPVAPALFLWAIVLFITGSKTSQKFEAQKKGSIEERD